MSINLSATVERSFVVGGPIASAAALRQARRMTLVPDGGCLSLSRARLVTFIF